MSSVDPRILERIKKCLSLANSSEPHEAAAAMRQAQKLMSQHGLSDADVELGAVKEERVRSVASSTKQKPWESTLATTVADAFGCLTLFATRHNDYARWVFIGPVSEVAIARHTFIVLQRQCSKARTGFVDQRYGLASYLSSTQKRQVTTDADAFAFYWVLAVKKEVERYAWTDARRNALERYVSKTRGELGEGKARDTRDQASDEAKRAGYDEGSQVKLRRATGTDVGSRAALGATAALTHKV